MRIMTDTNVLISAILFPSSRVSKIMWDILLKHELVLCSYIIDELHVVFDRKFKDKKQVLEEFLTELSFELIYTPKIIDVDKYPSIRDGKDFDEIDIDNSRIIKPSEYEL